MAALRNGTVVPQEFLTVYCEEYGQVRLSDKLISNVLILAICSFNGYSAVAIFRHRKLSPFRQRAPLLAIYHSLLYLMLIIIPMWPSWINTDSWSADSNGNLINSTKDIPFSRRLLKFLLTFTRLMVMWMIPFR